MSAKILLYDLETSPLLAWAWQRWQTNLLHVEQEITILSVAYKWLGQGKTEVFSQWDYEDFEPGHVNDYSVACDLWELFDEADIIVGHNSIKFDNGHSNNCFLHHELGRPSPFRDVDTLKVLRKHFNFSSNKLGEICNHLGLGNKVHHPGFSMWLDCMNGDESAQALMTKYAKQDVDLLEQLYLRLRPWIHDHPNLANYEDLPAMSCPTCGSANIQQRGFKYTQTQKYKQFVCKDCGSWGRHRLCEKAEIDGKMKSITQELTL